MKLPNDIIIIIINYARRPICNKLKYEIINYKYNKILKKQLLLYNNNDHYISRETRIRSQICSSLLTHCCI